MDGDELNDESGKGQTCPACGCSGQAPDSLKCDDCGRDLPAAKGAAERHQARGMDGAGLTREEFGAAVWAARQARRADGSKGMTAKEFFRRAVRNYVKWVTSDVIAKGGKIPQGVAETIAGWEL